MLKVGAEAMVMAKVFVEDRWMLWLRLFSLW